jgi:hypothetical protein
MAWSFLGNDIALLLLLIWIILFGEEEEVFVDIGCFFLACLCDRCVVGDFEDVSEVIVSGFV